jgi:very-short-patch-repair endonuclease
MTLKRAKRLRRALTDAERVLWTMLRARQNGAAKFRRQQPTGPYIEKKADGGQHGESPRDQVRDAWLAERGYRVLRFWNHDILGNAEGVVQVIAKAMETPHPPAAGQRVPPSPSRGEGEGDRNGRPI